MRQELTTYQVNAILSECVLSPDEMNYRELQGALTYLRSIGVSVTCRVNAITPILRKEMKALEQQAEESARALDLSSYALQR